MNLITGTTPGNWFIVPGAFFDDNFEISYGIGNLTIVPAEITVKAKDTTLDCFGTPPFEAEVSGFQYQDEEGVDANSGPSFDLLDDQNQSVATITAGGSYTIVPSDYSFAADSNYVIVYENGTLQLPDPLVLNASADPIGCFGATTSVTLLATGGNGGYQYGGDAISGLSEGSYQYTVTDLKGCTATASVTIQPAPAKLLISATVTQPNCHGETGSVILDATGGVGPYTYSNTPTTGLTNGTYVYEVTDANGCTNSIEVEIQAAPSNLVLNAFTTQPACFGDLGSVLLSPTGGVGPYTLGLDPVNDLGPGSYQYTVTDANGCAAVATAVINPAPDPVVLIATPVNPSCFGQTGSVLLSATGGNGTYTYGGDATTGLGSGTYQYTVSDVKGCSGSASAQIVVPTQISINTTSTPTGCSGNTGTATAAPSGGTPGYQYLWTPGGGTTATIGSLASGIYQVTVTDANGCTRTASVAVSSSGSAPATRVRSADLRAVVAARTALCSAFLPLPVRLPISGRLHRV